MKEFQGKYSKEIDASKGEFFVQIKQGKQIFCKKSYYPF